MRFIYPVNLSSRDCVAEQSVVDWFYFHFVLAFPLLGGFQRNFRQSKSFLLASRSTKTLCLMRATQDAERSGMSNVKKLYRAACWYTLSLFIKCINIPTRALLHTEERWDIPLLTLSALQGWHFSIDSRENLKIEIKEGGPWAPGSAGRGGGILWQNHNNSTYSFAPN